MSGRTHVCPGGCGRHVAIRLFACRGCWARLPRDRQRPILDAYFRGDTVAHIRAMVDARRWYRTAAS